MPALRGSIHSFKNVNMQPNFTLKRRGIYFGLTPVLFFLFFLLSEKINAQTYVNGILSTGATALNGTAAPAGTTWSECQNVTGDITVANSTAGVSAQVSGNFSVADDFVVPAGPSWNLTKITVYAYSTGAPGGTSPFNDLRIRIHDNNPMSGPTNIVYGDLTTNRLTASSNSGVYRIFNTLVPPSATATNRIIWKLEATVAVTLAPGTYWMEYKTGTALASNFVPLSAPLGVRTLAGYNAIQSNSGAWTQIFDTGVDQTLSDAGQPVAVDFPFRIDYTTGPCAGTPTPGATMASVTTACATTNFNLSLENATPGSGVTYQWQSASALTGPYTNITGATNPTLSTSLTATTYYQCVVTCSGNSGTSTPVKVDLTPASGCYCIPPSSTCTLDDEILNVTLGTLSNSSSGCSGSGYTNYTAVAAPTVYSGGSNPISVTIGPGGNDKVGAWIDYNQNGAFETSEFTLIGTTPGGIVTNNINVPASALSGTTRMRVRVRFGSAGIAGTDACSSFTFGETEDYNVSIAPCVPVTITTPPSSATILCGGSTSFKVVAAGSIPSYSWQYRPTASTPWQTVTNGGIYSGATTNTLVLTTVPQSMNGYQYRALVTGGCSAVDFTTPPSTLTVNPLIATVSKTPTGNICVGSIQKLSITNTSPATTVAVASNPSLGVTIPDDGSTVGVNNSLNVAGIPAGVVISGIRVKVNLAHSWAGDMIVVVKAPNGKILNLAYALNGTGGAGSTTGFTPTFSSTLSPAKYLDAGSDPYNGIFSADGYDPTTGDPTVPTGPDGFIPTSVAATRNTFSDLYTSAANSSTLNGTWTIAMYDYFSDFTTSNKFNNWSVEIDYTGGFANGVWTSPAPNSLFTDAAATIPYDGVTPVNTVYAKPATAGTFNYSVVVNNGTCTTPALTVPVTVIGNVGTVTNPANKSVCVGGSTSFTASATGGPNTYQWQVSTDGGVTWNNISGETSTILSLTGVTQTMNNNRYRAVITASPCTGSVNTTAAVLTVNALPVVTVSAPDVALKPGESVTVTANSTPAAGTSGYSWTRDGVALTGNSNSRIATIDSLGSYKATVTDVNGCVNSSNSLVIGAEASDKLWIYPNPTQGQFQVRLYFQSGIPEDRIVSVYNSMGQLIAKKEFYLINTTTPYLRMDFDLSKSGRGTYVVKVAHKYTGKVISGIVLVL